jgi:hypothetical protein
MTFRQSELRQSKCIPFAVECGIGMTTTKTNAFRELFVGRLTLTV